MATADLVWIWSVAGEAESKCRHVKLSLGKDVISYDIFSELTVSSEHPEESYGWRD